MAAGDLLSQQEAFASKIRALYPPQQIVCSPAKDEAVDVVQNTVDVCCVCILSFVCQARCSSSEKTPHYLKPGVYSQNSAFGTASEAQEYL